MTAVPGMGTIPNSARPQPSFETLLRIHLKSTGFSPIPLTGKIPNLSGWQKQLNVADDEIKLWEHTQPHSRNTGLLTRYTPAIDLDILDEAAAQALEDLAREQFEERGAFLVRIGKAPKRAILLRTDEPFTKIFATFAGGQKIEILGDGQQLACFGVHPDTKRNYSWSGGQPGKIARDELPYVREADAKAFVEAAVQPGSNAQAAVSPQSPLRRRSSHQIRIGDRSSRACSVPRATMTTWSGSRPN